MTTPPRASLSQDFLELNLESSCNLGASKGAVGGRNFEKNAKMCIWVPFFTMRFFPELVKTNMKKQLFFGVLFIKYYF